MLYTETPKTYVPNSDIVRKIIVNNCDAYKPSVRAKIRALNYINSIVEYEIRMMTKDNKNLINPCINHGLV